MTIANPDTSATGGYLSPAGAPAPLEGQALFRFFHDLFAGILQIDPALVRPRWQVEPPNQPDLATVSWLAFGITARATDTFAYVGHVGAVGATPGYDQLQRHEELTILTSHYGPEADLNAEVLRDGLQIAQNREVLQLNNMSVIETGEALTVPVLVKERWLYRVDLSVRIRRQITRNYPVLDLASAAGTIASDTTTTPFSITN